MRGPGRGLLLIAALLACAGCKVGPKYERPVIETPTNWHWQQAQTASVVLDDHWWQAFKDPKLDELVAQALQYNQDIQQALARVDEARALARVRKADFYPGLSTTPSFMRSGDSANTFLPGAPAGGISGVRQPHNFFSLPLDVSYEADVWGRVRRSFDAARNRAEASVADYTFVLLTVTSDTAVNYFLLRSLDAEVEVLQNTLKLREESLKLVSSKFKFGAIDALDVARAKTDVSTTEAAIADAKRRREAAVNVLAILCGKPASEFTVAAQPLPAGAPEIPAGLPSALLQRRPDVIRAERTLMAANEEIGVAQAAFFPRLALTGAAGFQSQDLTSLLNWNSTAWNVAANIVQPVFTGGRNKAELEAARARYDQAQAAYRQQVLVAFKDVEDALIDIKFRAEQAKALDEAIASAREVTKLATTRYEQGQVSSLDVVDAQRRQLEVEQQAPQLAGERLLSTIRLIKALGGGW